MTDKKDKTEVKDEVKAPEGDKSNELLGETHDKKDTSRSNLKTGDMKIQEIKDRALQARKDPAYKRLGRRLELPPAKEGMTNRWILVEDMDSLSGNLAERIDQGWLPIDPNTLDPATYTGKIMRCGAVGQNVLTATSHVGGTSILIAMENASDVVNQQMKHFQNQDEAFTKGVAVHEAGQYGTDSQGNPRLYDVENSTEYLRGIHNK